MRPSNMIVMVMVLFISTTAAFATPTDLSAKISGSRPWTGGCGPLIDCEAKMVLPHDLIGCSVRFSCGWVDGYLRKGEPVGYTVESVNEDGEWRCLTRTLRCGNPARGRVWVPYLKPIVRTQIVDRPVPYAVPVDPVVSMRIVERQVPVEVVRTKTVYVDRQEPARQYIPPPSITPLYTPALAVNMGSTTVGPWQTLVSGAVALVPDAPKVCRDGEEPRPPDCGPGKPGEPPSPGNAAGPVEPGLVQPGDSAISSTQALPTPAIGGTGTAIPDMGTLPVTPAWSGNAAPAP